MRERISAHKNTQGARQPPPHPQITVGGVPTGEPVFEERYMSDIGRKLEQFIDTTTERLRHRRHLPRCW